MDDERRPESPPADTPEHHFQEDQRHLRDEFTRAFPRNGKAQLVKFTMDRQLQPNYGGLPYTSALISYFMLQALHPEQAEQNFERFLTDFNSLAQTSEREDLDQVPTRAFLESVAKPHLDGLEQPQALEH
ncbi:MAG: hypothetical protein H6858_08255 [Rhodospirillales bacterium]|nr:hypothetical protein [Alphaproteobacteria bacterium]MCB1840714.1 hypothetical protein [Alphaproteobacteria bacterium]MCB9977572.1 hypothetical protein [Rhodospirillales bacterium]